MCRLKAGALLVHVPQKPKRVWLITSHLFLVSWTSQRQTGWMEMHWSSLPSVFSHLSLINLLYVRTIFQRWLPLNNSDPFTAHFFHWSHLRDLKHCEWVCQCCYGNAENPLMHSDRRHCILLWHTARFFTFSWLYSRKEHGHISRNDSWNDNHRRGLRRRGDASQTSWRQLGVCVLVWVSCRGRVHFSDVIRESHRAHSHVSVCVCLCVQKHVWIEILMAAVTPTDALLLRVLTQTHPSKALRCCQQQEHGTPTLKRWDEHMYTHIHHAPQQKSMHVRNNSLLGWNIKKNPAILDETCCKTISTDRSKKWSVGQKTFQIKKRKLKRTQDVGKQAVRQMRFVKRHSSPLMSGFTDFSLWNHTEVAPKSRVGWYVVHSAVMVILRILLFKSLHPSRGRSLNACWTKNRAAFK